MHKKIVVENSLQNHIDFLEKSGYDVHKLYKNENLYNITSSKYAGIIVDDLSKIGSESNTNNKTNAPIIEAKGKTPEQVYDILNSTH